jgi:hypothetical protein
LIGATGAILLTAVWFAIIHLLGVTYMPAITMPIFLVNTLTLGIGCGLLMHKTGSIWGAVLIHAAADLYLFVAMLAVTSRGCQAGGRPKGPGRPDIRAIITVYGPPRPPACPRRLDDPPVAVGLSNLAR